MRQSFLNTFTRNYVVDLHGNVKKGAGGYADQNVFDIQQGVAVGLWAKLEWQNHRGNLFHGEMIGDRSHKYDQLLRETIRQTASFEVIPSPRFYLFVPQSKDLQDEYSLWVGLQNLFRESTMGVTTGRDQLCVSFNKKEAVAKLIEFTSKMPESEIAAQYGLSNKSGWNIEAARKSVRSSGVDEERVHAFSYRPFDDRVLYSDTAIVGRLRLEVMRNMLGKTNLALCSTRQVNVGFHHVFCTRLISNDCFISLSSGERTYSFPLFKEPDISILFHHKNQESNLNQEFLADLKSNIGLSKTDSQQSNLELSPQDFFQYMYSVLHSPGYRNRYAEFLKIDFPRIPFPGSLDLFHDLAQLGGELVALHLMESPKLDHFITTYTGSKNPEVERVGWSDDTVWLDAAATKKGLPATPGTIGFRGVPEEVWNFHIGGYQVCEKWLKDRKGRTLNADDIAHYHRIVVALAETIRVIGEIDEVIEEHGGWPGAFTAGRQESQ